MKTPSHIVRIVASVIALFAAVPLVRAQNIDSWNGSGGSGDLFWLDGVNWQSGIHPATGDQLVFTNTVGLINSNNYPALQPFAGITFATPSGAFALSGNSVTLTNDIIDLQPATPETINLPLVLGGLSGSVNVAATTNSVLNLKNVISGTGLTSSGAGTVNLSGTNTFTGPVTITAGTVGIVADTNLGLANIVLNGGTLQTLTTMTLSSNRTITVGSPSSAGGSGTIQVITNTLTITAPVFPTVSYDGVIGNNTGGASGLNKLGFGTLTLFGPNAYTGTTSNEVGTLTLDFSQTALTANIISSSSKLVLGGAISGGFGTNYAQLIVTGKASTTDSQAFNGTHLTFGASQIQANSGASGGIVNLSLGAFDHDVGSVAVLQIPATGSGNITTPTPNGAGSILGGWATIGQPTLLGYVRGTNWACVDAGGNVTNFYNFFNYTTNDPNIGYPQTLHSTVDANTTGVETNLLINTSTATICPVDNPGAGTTTDINSIKFGSPTGSLPSGANTGSPADAVVIGVGNTLRLGVYGGVLKEENTGDVCFIGGTNLNESLFFNLGVTNSQDVGTLTAGGPSANTPGEIVCNADGNNNTSGTIQFGCQIVDNGASGPVTFIKTGAGSIKLAGHNTYSGGLYILQGRVQFDGSEIGTSASVTVTNDGVVSGVSSGNLNPDGGGTGPIYVLPGCYLFLNSTTVYFPFTNQLYIAGCGDGSEPLGAVRGGIFAGPVTMIGDTDLGGNPTMLGPISGPFNLTLGSEATVNGGAILCNTNNNWTGNTIMTARNNASTNIVTMSNNVVIPNGSGFGNVFVQAFSGAGAAMWHLNGFNQTINGLSTIGASLAGSSGDVTNCVIFNSSPTASTLTLGNNDQSGLWGGDILGGGGVGSVNTGTINIIKIGAGVETFTNMNTYTGITTVSNGVLQLTVNGSINNSSTVNINGGTFDVSALNYAIPATQNINVSGGTFLIGNASSSGGLVNFTDGTLKVSSLSIATANLTVPTLNVGGVNNFIQPANIPLIPAYPVTFPIIQYTTLNGDPTTISAVLPTGGFPAFAGYIFNDTVNKQIDLVLTNGPITPQLTWVGLNGGVLDANWNSVDANWTNIPAHLAANYSDGSLVVFNDTGHAGVVTLAATPNGFQPAGVTVANTNVNYTFIGGGSIGSVTLLNTNGITKLGPGKLTLDNTGGDNYNGGLAIGGGIVQVGVNDTGGSLGAPNNSVGNNGVLVFNRVNNNLVVTNPISGSGSLLVSNAGGTTLTLAGANTFGGGASVIFSNILQAGNASALGTGTNLIANGAALDVNGFALSGAAVNVSGAGVTTGGVTNGAIYNGAASSSGPPQVTKVTLLGDTVFGCPPSGLSISNRWDIRGTGAALSTGSQPYNLIKVGNNQISIVGAAVDPMLNNIDVQGGELGFQTTSTGLGNPLENLYIRNTAALEMYNATNQLNKMIQMGTVSTDITSLLSDSGNNTIIGPMVLNGSFSSSGAVNVMVTNNSTLTLSNSISGGGSFNVIGPGTLVLAGNDSYSGGTTINAGTFIMNGVNNSSGNVNNELTVNVGTTVGGNGTYTVPVDIEAVLWPGVGGKPSTLNLGNNVVYVDQYSTPYSALTFGAESGTPTNIFSLNTATTVGGGVNDLINVTGTLGANGTQIIINPLSSLLTGSTYTLVTYSGGRDSSYNGSVQVVASAQPSRYQFSLDQVSTPNKVLLTVSTGVGTMEWNDAAGNSVWDVGTTLNWTNTSTATPVNPTDYQFYQEDNVVLDDSIANTPANTTLTITNEVVTNNIITAVLPASITVNSTNNNYTINGVGKISGNVNIIKEGPSMFTIGNTNDFTGTVMVSGGSLRLDNTNALGSVNTTVTVTNGGTLDFGGPDLTANSAPLVGARAIYISGWGVNSNGCLINSSTNLTQEDAAQNIIMTGDAAIGGNAPINAAGRFDLGRLSPATLTSNGHNLIKVGTNQVSLVGLAVDSNLGNIDIQGGELGVETGTTLGDPTKTITVESGAVLEFFETTNTINKPIIVNGGALAQGTYENIQFNGGGIPNNSISSTVWITNGMVVVGGGVSGTFSNVISGPSSLTIAGPVYMDATNTYTGNTIVSNTGTLFLVGTASINNSTNITLGGGTIDVSGRTNTTLTLGGLTTLTGVGTINGTLTNNGALSIGVNSTNTTVGTLTITTNATLLGTTALKLDAGNATNDVLSAGGNLVYGGTLTVTNISATPLSGGQSFKLFNAATYSGLFGTVNLPVLSAGLTWQNNLTVNGTISVLSSTPAVPHITGIILSGTTLTITATNGSNGGTWTLLQSTNVALPLSEWETNITGTFDGSGDLSTNIANTVSNAQEFYILKQ